MSTIATRTFMTSKKAPPAAGALDPSGSVQAPLFSYTSFLLASSKAGKRYTQCPRGTAGGKAGDPVKDPLHSSGKDPLPVTWVESLQEILTLKSHAKIGASEIQVPQKWEKGVSAEDGLTISRQCQLLGHSLKEVMYRACHTTLQLFNDR